MPFDRLSYSWSDAEVGYIDVCDDQGGDGLEEVLLETTISPAACESVVQVALTLLHFSQELK